MGNDTNVVVGDALTARMSRRAKRFFFTSFAALAMMAATSPGALAADDAVSADVPIKVTFLGTGTPVPNPRQSGPGVLVEAGGEKLLFDCGRGCASQLWNLDHDLLRQTHHLFLTHMHSDHTVGVPDLYMNGWNLGRKDPLNVYGPIAADEFMRHLRLAFEEDVVFRADLQHHSVTRDGLSHVVKEVKDNEKIVIGDVTITPILVDHYVIKPAFGYRIDAGGYSVVISGDTTYSENLVRHSTDADVLIHEVFSPAIERFVRKTFPEDVADNIVALHTLAPDVGRVFQKSNIRLGVLTHLDNDPKHIPELAQKVQSSWDGKFVVAKDMMVIEIGETIRVVEPSAK